jgi:hypothetical protein
MTSNVELSPLLLEKLKAFFANVFSSDKDTQDFLGDPDGAFAAHGIDAGILSNVDIDQLVNSCAYPEGGGQPGGGAGGAGSGGGGAAASAGGGGYAPPPQTVQQVTQVTQQYYQDNSTTFIDASDNSTHIDNSVDVDVEGGLHGDIDIDTQNLNQVGDGNVGNIGDGDVNAATGDGAVAQQGGEGNVAATGGGVAAGGSISDSPINTGINTGNMVGDVDDANLNFGDGNQTATQIDGDITDSAVSNDGDANNLSNNTLEEGAAAAAGGDATGHQETDIDVDVDLGRSLVREPLEVAAPQSSETSEEDPAGF